jgi:hypothetical protein
MCKRGENGVETHAALMIMRKAFDEVNRIRIIELMTADSDWGSLIGDCV